VNRVASFIGEGLAAGEHVIVLATLAHSNAISARLEETGIDYGRAAAERRLVLLDADDVLDGITIDGRVSTDAFRESVGRVVQKESKQRIYGELVSLLTQAGNLEAALAIESLGHELAHTLDIPVLCGYHAGGYAPLSAAAIARIEAVHDRSVVEEPAGRYVRAAENQAAAAVDQFHAVQFYDSRASLAGIVGRFLGEGFVAGLPAIVIATAEHREAISQVLSAHYFDLERLTTVGDLIMGDADEALASFMLDGMPDPDRFSDAIIPLIEKASRGRRNCVIRAYGEMVDVLWRVGQTAAAIRLETLWNQLAQSHSFSLLCGYSMGNFYKDAGHSDVRRLHTHEMHNSGESLLH
jgi:KaiC/GvpD/RAD55 family RecA-like ATPase